MTLNGLIPPFSNILSDLTIRIIGSNQFIRPSVPSDQKYCTVKQQTPLTCTLTVKPRYTNNTIILSLTRKGNNIFLRVEDFNFRDPYERFTCDIYYKQRLLLAKVHMRVGTEVKLIQPTITPRKPGKLAPPSFTFPLPKSIGIISLWRAKGLGVDAKILRDVLSPQYSVYVLALNKNVDNWPEENVTFTGLNREQLTPDHVLKWVKEHRISKVLILEPVKKEVWHVVKALKEIGIKVYGVPNIEITRESEIEDHKLFDAILCKTKLTYQVLEDQGLTNLSYIGWGVDTDLLKPSLAPKKGELVFFHNAGWGGDAFRKNTEAVVKAFDKASETLNNIKLHVHTQLAWTHYPEEVKKIAKENASITVSEGTVPYKKIVEMTQQADVALLPSKYEGGGLPFYEALACGLPIITVDAPPMNEIVIDGFNGYVCKVSFEKLPSNPHPLIEAAVIDLDDFVDKILKVASDNQVLKQMSLNARKEIEENHSLSLFKQRLKQLFPKILAFIGDYFYPLKGGAEHSVYTFLKMALENNCEAYALCFKGFETFKETRVDGIFIAQCPYPEMMGKSLADVKPDVVLTQLLKAPLVVSLAKKLEIPTVLFIRSFSEHICGRSIMRCRRDLLTCPQGCRGWREMKKQNEELFRQADLIVSNSNYSRKVIKRFFKRESIVMYPSVDEKFRSVKASDDGYILFVKPNLLKGSEVVLKLTSLLPDEKFAVCGEGTYNMFSRQRNVTYFGHQEDMASVYAGAKLVLVPSQAPEGFGRVPIEAMACGIPVIASNLGGLKEACAAGYLVKNYTDAYEWAKAIKEALSNKDAIVERQNVFVENFFKEQRHQVNLLLKEMELLR